MVFRADVGFGEVGGYLPRGMRQVSLEVGVARQALGQSQSAKTSGAELSSLPCKGTGKVRLHLHHCRCRRSTESLSRTLRDHLEVKITLNRIRFWLYHGSHWERKSHFTKLIVSILLHKVLLIVFLKVICPYPMLFPQTQIRMLS